MTWNYALFGFLFKDETVSRRFDLTYRCHCRRNWLLPQSQRADEYDNDVMAVATTVSSNTISVWGLGSGITAEDRTEDGLLQ